MRRKRATTAKNTSLIKKLEIDEALGASHIFFTTWQKKVDKIHQISLVILAPIRHGNNLFPPNWSQSEFDAVNFGDSVGDNFIAGIFDWIGKLCLFYDAGETRGYSNIFYPF